MVIISTKDVKKLRWPTLKNNKTSKKFKTSIDISKHKNRKYKNFNKSSKLICKFCKTNGIKFCLKKINLLQNYKILIVYLANLQAMEIILSSGDLISNLIKKMMKVEIKNKIKKNKFHNHLNSLHLKLR